MISENLEGSPSASIVQSAESGGNGSADWWSIERAAAYLSVTARAVRRWAAGGSVIARKDPHTASWEVRADSLPSPRNPGAVSQRRKSARPESPGVSDLVRLLQSAHDEARTLAGRVGWLESENARLRETDQKLLPAAAASLDALRRRDSRLLVEVICLVCSVMLYLVM